MVTVLESLNNALHQAFSIDERVCLLGEDVLDPYGGAFKVTRGLSTSYPSRIFTTPISEAAIIGISAGLALRGFRPVVEIMFGDFVTLIADQLINHIAKFRWMYNDQVTLPLVIRTPMGGRRGYGPTHSQSLEKLYLGVPGLKVISPTFLGDPGGLLCDLILYSEDPVLFIENKLLYLLEIKSKSDLLEYDLITVNEQSMNPCFILDIRGAPPPSITIAAYGYMAELACQAMLRVAYEDEIFTELVIPTQLAPFDVSPITTSTHKTGRLLTIEEGTYSLGWGAEILARTIEAIGNRLTVAHRMAAMDLPVPASRPLEHQVLPAVEDIIFQIKKIHLCT